VANRDFDRLTDELIQEIHGIKANHRESGRPTDVLAVEIQ
jgi:ssRNA-specific RNase YbeY (16S rRNA maturation enzyme)